MKTTEPVWVRDDIVLAIHQRQLAEHGGGEGIRDAGLLHSALHRPKNLYQYTNPKPELAAMAAAYAYGICKNHPFVDGNKRTAFIVCQLFLSLNNAKLNAPADDKYKMFIKLASGALFEDALAKWIGKHL